MRTRSRKVKVSEHLHLINPVLRNLGKRGPSKTRIIYKTNLLGQNLNLYNFLVLFPCELSWVSLSPELAWITVNCSVDRNLAFQHCFGGGAICWHPLKWWRYMHKISSKNQCGDFAFKMRSNFICSKNPSWCAGLEWRTALYWEIFTAGWRAPCVPSQIALQHVKKKLH